MKRNIGNASASYSTPAVVVGATVDGRPTWTLVAHDRLLVSLHSAHHINKGIRETGFMPVNIVTEEFLSEADYCSIASGAKTDKSGVFDGVTGDGGTLMVGKSPLGMNRKVVDVYRCGYSENFICEVLHTRADDGVLGADGKLDYGRFKPVLFKFPTCGYLRTGSVIGHCTDAGKQYGRGRS